MRELQIAIDGPAGAGKSTVARELARKLGYLYIDTGAMYRAVALKALELGADLEDGEALVRAVEQSSLVLQPGAEGGAPRVFLDGKDVSQAIRHPDVTAAASRVARLSAVRAWLVNLQRRMARGGGVVMDGRDVGTVVLPDADVKIFLTASLEERTRRRHQELAAHGHAVSYEDLKREISQRDRLDEEREDSPLRQAEDAILIDTTGRGIDEIVDEIYRICQQRRLQLAEGKIP